MKNRINRALTALSRGGMVVVTDDENRENEGDLVMAARFATEKTVNFMIRKGGGLICVPVEEARAQALGLVPMCGTNSDPHGTAFTVSVDSVLATTGISAADRARTIRALATAGSTPRDFRIPGHMFPLIARSGGTLQRRGHTEASVDLVRRIIPAGEPSVAVICEILSRNGTMLRGSALSLFSRVHRIPQVSIQEIADFERTHPSKRKGVQRRAETILPTEHGSFRLFAYEELASGKEHLALVFGNPDSANAPLCRIHSECLTGDVLRSKRCDCGEQLAEAMRRISRTGAGIIVYLRQEGRGIGLVNKLRAYELQDQGYDTVDANLQLGFQADERDYRAGAEILRDLGISTVTLMTNNPDKVSGLISQGISVTGRSPVIITPGTDNKRYLETKMKRMNHQLNPDNTTPVMLKHQKEGIYERV